MPPVTVLRVVMMRVMVMLLLLSKSTPCRAVVKVQKSDNDGQKGSKSEADDETNLDIVVLGGIVRELSLDVSCRVLASLTA